MADTPRQADDCSNENENETTQPTKNQVSKKFIFLVRHGESRWNRAQGTGNVCGMLGESDHGLSDEGREQSENLRRLLANAKINLQCGKVPGWERVWLERALNPDVIISSPFTRAMQTAVIA